MAGKGTTNPYLPTPACVTARAGVCLLWRLHLLCAEPDDSHSQVSVLALSGGITFKKSQKTSTTRAANVARRFRICQAPALTEKPDECWCDDVRQQSHSPPCDKKETNIYGLTLSGMMERKAEHGGKVNPGVCRLTPNTCMIVSQSQPFSMATWRRSDAATYGNRVTGSSPRNSFDPLKLGGRPQAPAFRLRIPARDYRELLLHLEGQTRGQAELICIRIVFQSQSMIDVNSLLSTL